MAGGATDNKTSDNFRAVDIGSTIHGVKEKVST